MTCSSSEQLTYRIGQGLCRIKFFFYNKHEMLLIKILADFVSLALNNHLILLEVFLVYNGK